MLASAGLGFDQVTLQFALNITRAVALVAVRIFAAAAASSRGVQCNLPNAEDLAGGLACERKRRISQPSPEHSSLDIVDQP